MADDEKLNSLQRIELEKKKKKSKQKRKRNHKFNSKRYSDH